MLCDCMLHVACCTLHTARCLLHIGMYLISVGVDPANIGAWSRYKSKYEVRSARRLPCVRQHRQTCLTPGTRIDVSNSATQAFLASVCHGSVALV